MNMGSMASQGLEVTAAACLDYCDSLSTGICQYVTFGLEDDGEGSCTIFAAGCGIEYETPVNTNDAQAAHTSYKRYVAIIYFSF